MISTLPALIPDSRRAECVRARCRTRLERGRRRSRKLAAVARVGHYVIPPAFAAALGFAYVVELVSTALRALSRAI